MGPPLTGSGRGDTTDEESVRALTVRILTGSRQVSKSGSASMRERLLHVEVITSLASHPQTATVTLKYGARAATAV